MNQRNFRLGKNHGIDDVDDSVRANQIRGDNLGIVDHHAGRVGLQLQRFTVNGRRFSGLHICGHDLGWNDVIGENRNELGFVFWQQKRFHGAGGQLGESGVGRRKNGERVSMVTDPISDLLVRIQNGLRRV